MAITNGYATLAQLRARLEFSASDTADDTILENIIEACSRRIDSWTGTRFYANADTRYYTAQYGDLLFVDDLLSVTTLSTDENDSGTYTNWATTTDYNLMPYNAQLESQPQPYTHIEITSNGDYTFPRNIKKGVKIVGSFGYSSTTPMAVQEACLLMSQRIYRRKDAIFGVAGGGQLGTDTAIMTMKMDSDIQELLKAVKKVNLVTP